MATRKKLLPKNFEQLVEAGDAAALQAVMERCEPNARGGYGKQPALAFCPLPEAFARWLVAQGADLQATDTWGSTPLHLHAGSWNGQPALLLALGARLEATSNNGNTPLHAACDHYQLAHVRTLLAAGADIGARQRDGLTPLELALRGCSNSHITGMAELAEVLLAGGAQASPACRGFVRQIGERFEQFRSAFSPADREETSAALERLYARFDVPPVPRRVMHDGTSPIRVSATTWQAQHAELWELLVPPRGPASTVQGEVIRITGKVAREWLDNGGVNWSNEYAELPKALLGYLGLGNALGESELAEVSAIVRAIRQRADDLYQVSRLAVAWVLRNPGPMPLPPRPTGCDQK